MIADESMLGALRGLTAETLIYDASGRRVGRFIPEGPTDEEVYARAGELLDLEEAERRKVSEHGRCVPLSEIMARLKARGIDACDTP